MTDDDDGALSQDEINRLLGAVDAAYAADKEESGGSAAENYPNKFSREQLRAISLLHEKFTRIANKSLSAKLRITITMNVASVDQLTLGDFFRSIPTPTTLGIITMEPLEGSVILEIDPRIAFAIIDRIHGSKEKATKPRHELTDTGKIIMQGIFVSLLENLREAWSEIIDLRPRLDKIETDPRFIRIAPPAEGVVLVTLEAKMGDVEGMLNFCIPYPVLEPITEKLW